MGAMQGEFLVRRRGRDDARLRRGLHAVDVQARDLRRGRERPRRGADGHQRARVPGAGRCWRWRCWRWASIPTPFAEVLHVSVNDLLRLRRPGRKLLRLNAACNSSRRSRPPTPSSSCSAMVCVILRRGSLRERREPHRHLRAHAGSRSPAASPSPGSPSSAEPAYTFSDMFVDDLMSDVLKLARLPLASWRCWCTRARTSPRAACSAASSSRWCCSRRSA